MNCLLQPRISVLGTQGNGAAWLNNHDCFQYCQPSMHRWQYVMAASDILYNPYTLHHRNTCQEDKQDAWSPVLKFRHSAVIVPFLWLLLVLATGLGYPAAARGWNWTGWSTTGCFTEISSTDQAWGWVRTRLQFHNTVPATFAPSQYLSFYCIIAWSIRKLFRSSRSFTSSMQIYNPTDIRWMVVK